MSHQLLFEGKSAEEEAEHNKPYVDLAKGKDENTIYLVLSKEDQEHLVKVLRAFRPELVQTVKDLPKAMVSINEKIKAEAH